MSADRRRQLRTQGRFVSSTPESCESKQKENAKERNEQTKVQNGSDKDCDERMTQGNREIDKRTGDSAGQQFIRLPQRTSTVTYQENCPPVVTPFDAPKQPEEIKVCGLKILSVTGYGESRVHYYPVFIKISEAFDLYDKLARDIPWRQMNIVIHGREYRQPRLVAWYGPFPYAYSGVVLNAQEMSDDILQIKKNMENFLAERNINAVFNSVLLNYYRTGSDSVAWHSDDELSMGIDPTIASVSLGEVRKFEMRRKPSEAERDPPIEYFVRLKPGSLLIMDGVMQMDWQHRVPKESTQAPRINLTFRTVHKDKRLLKAKK